MRYLFCVLALLAISQPCFADDKPSGYDTPEAAFNAYLTGCVKHDWDLVLSSCTPKSRGLHVAKLVVFMGWVFEGKEIKALLSEHGLSVGDIAYIRGRNSREPIVLVQHTELEGIEFQNDDEEVMVRMMLKVKDAPNLMEKIWERFSQARNAFLAEDLKEELLEADALWPRRSVEEILAEIKVMDVQTDIDEATCRVAWDNPKVNAVMSDEEKAKRYAIRRINGRWYCDHGELPFMGNWHLFYSLVTAS